MDNNILITIVVTVFASSGFWQWIISRNSKKDKKTEALLALLHNEIYRISEKAIKDGSITSDELDNLTCLYTPYHDLGGNGTGEILYTKAKNLVTVVEKKGE